MASLEEEKDSVNKKAAKKEEKKRKKEEKKQQKALKAELNEDADEGIGSKIAIVIITIVIIIIWLGILALVIKLDVGGFGSTVLHPVLKDIPYVNRILPETTSEEEVVDVQYPYKTMEEAINRIKELEVELSEALKQTETSAETIAQLQAEIDRLREFETEQAKFQEEKTKFYQEVVFSDNSPDIEEYKSYYESIDAANAAELYKQVVQKVAYDDELKDYAETYASMKPKQAAGILEEMTDDMKLVAEILEYMDAESRGNILGAMDPKIAAKITKLMEPKEP